ncbi:MAG: TldD/PmbA family protein, partial [Chloroflexota bacterium]|nr:TldD/PmbA family protein [Chloroflexota bacterium]
MNDLIERAIDAATGSGAAYADVRIVEHQAESLTVKNGSLAAASSERSAGFAVRVLVEGAWGFASSQDLGLDESQRVARQAVAIARASRLAGGPAVVLDDTAPAAGHWGTPYVEDPFAVSFEDKLRILFEADAAMASVPGVSVREGTVEAGRERKTFA